MVLYLLVIVAANVGLGYALIVYLKRRARFLSWSAQQAQAPQRQTAAPDIATVAPAVEASSPAPTAQDFKAATDDLPALGDARQLKATIDNGLSQITARETPADDSSPELVSVSS